jgi:DNA-binding transcriptional regulator YdaS (Cro superfamily)
MKLSDYLDSAGSLTPAQLGALVKASLGQVNQWRTSWRGRKPSPAKAVAIEKATESKVRRWDLRPSDWWQIWPELVGVKGAPRVKGQSTRKPATAAAPDASATPAEHAKAHDRRRVQTPTPRACLKRSTDRDGPTASRER